MDQSQQKTVLTVGVYDLIHIGHVELFRRAKALGDRLVVAVQADEAVCAHKPQAKTALSTEERCYMVKAIRYVDEVIVYREVDQLVQTLDFQVFAKGPDQSHEGFLRAVAWCTERNIQVVTLPRTEGISSSKLKELIRTM